MTINLYDGDVPSDLNLGDIVAVDTETQGLQPQRDRLCLVQLSNGDGNAHLVKFGPNFTNAPNLKKILGDPNILKLFHFARFDIAVLQKYLEVITKPVYCTKIASRLVRTYTDKHGLKDLCKELLNIELSKEQQSSDWGSSELSEKQLKYAASDVLYLHGLKKKLDVMLLRESRMELAISCFDFVAVRAELDLAGWSQVDIFSH